MTIDDMIRDEKEQIAQVKLINMNNLQAKSITFTKISSIRTQVFRYSALGKALEKQSRTA